MRQTGVPVSKELQISGNIASARWYFSNRSLYIKETHDALPSPYLTLFRHDKLSPVKFPDAEYLVIPW
jgi:hypothetical protein